MITQQHSVLFRNHAAAPAQGGIALLEVLIVATLLAIALLGLASVQSSSLHFNQSAYHHTQAALLAQEIIEKMRGNRRAARAGHYANTMLSPSTLPTAPVCTEQLCTGEEVARSDLRQWGGKVFTALPDATATLRFNEDQQRYNIVLRWTERGAATSAEQCLQMATDGVACLQMETHP